ncbi:MAG: ribokinase [Melioribacteraceae bacterium]|nr:ribokinase [Melioribacteraceae bacterium]MCF8355470.1 ribokinase [Melioribacteraceae bacterium]MCF8392553.1 ribokinase [Melioribacteraceae bacterium]MCF8418432.1 ribokinase [Melioribacteraceae bacterium]
MNTDGVLVVGSVNMDMVVSTNRFPKPGETIFGSDFKMFPGGKGANQATACSRLGAKTLFLGKLGNDDFAKSLGKSMSENGIDPKYLIHSDDVHTGMAMITVNEEGENEIVVVSGANMSITPGEIERTKHAFGEVKIVVTQFEVPYDVVKKTAEITKEFGHVFILNPAPAAKIKNDLYELIDFITPNENELQSLTGIKVNSKETAELAARELISLGVKNVIVTMGSAGSLFVNSKTSKIFTTDKVHAIDTTGAGDTFNGALAFSLANGYDIDKAIKIANKAASIAITKMGAQSSMPYLSEIEDFLTKL